MCLTSSVSCTLSCNGIPAVLTWALGRVSQEVISGVAKNVEAARDAIFTPGPDELVTKEEMMNEAASLDGDIVERLGGPEVVYDLISRFYAKLFNDQELKYFFVLSSDRLRGKQVGPELQMIAKTRCDDMR